MFAFPSFSQSQSQSQSSLSPFPSPSISSLSYPFPEDTETLFADPWNSQPPFGVQDTSIPTKPWSPGSTSSSSADDQQGQSSSSTSTSPQHDTPETTTTTIITSRSTSKSSLAKSTSQSIAISKNGKPILAASLKRQLRRQRQRARTEPKIIELADGQKMNLGKRRSKYAAALEKLNQDLAALQAELTKQKQQNQELDHTNQILIQQNQQLVVQQASQPRFIEELQFRLNQMSKAKSHVLHQHQSSTIRDFFKMSSPVMLVLMDFNLRILDANQAYLSEHGWTRDELIGRRLPLFHMAMFFVPGYDSQKIPIDEHDIPPLHGGLPRGMVCNAMHSNPANYALYQKLFAGKIDSVTIREMSMDGKGRLFKTTQTSWLAYYKPEDHIHDHIFTSDLTSNITMSRPISMPDDVTAPVYARPMTQVDEYFTQLIAKPEPQYVPQKGYPKYFCSMESCYDREYLISNTLDGPIHPHDHGYDSHLTPFVGSHLSYPQINEDDVAERERHQLPWTAATKPLTTIYKIAQKMVSLRRSGLVDRHSALALAPAPFDVSSPPPLSSSSRAFIEEITEDSSDDDDPFGTRECHNSDAGAILTVLMQKAKKSIVMKKMQRKQMKTQPQQQTQTQTTTLRHSTNAPTQQNMTNISFQPQTQTPHQPQPQPQPQPQFSSEAPISCITNPTTTTNSSSHTVPAALYATFPSPSSSSSCTSSCTPSPTPLVLASDADSDPDMWFPVELHSLPLTSSI